MASNQFENSRISEGTLNQGGNTLADTSHVAPSESRTISRDDERDGVEKAPPHNEKNVRPVLAASTITGDRVRNSAGEDLGKIEEIMLDVPSGRIAYAVLSYGGFMGIGDKLFAVPWSALRIDTAEHEFVLDVDKNVLETAPGFDKDNWPDMAQPDFARSIHKFYNKTPYWEKDFTDSGDYMGDNVQTNRDIEFEKTQVTRPATRH
jgi:sporulation protein YlmC with PRC-barrel domain